jgi:phage antirepressor YoqD-like protein
MTNIILSDSPQNPFDSIAQTSSNGEQYWSSRQLMSLLGYSKWQTFERVIDAAIENVETIDSTASQHFLFLEVMGKKDIRLTRFAAYHVALACDSRGKDAVKLAKQYFVIKTRQAELGEQKPQLSRMQILEMAIEAERELVALKAQVQADEPATALGQALINSSDPKNIRIGDFAKILGDVGQNRYFDELRECGIITLTSPLPYQKHIDSGFFRVTQVPGKGAASNRWFSVALITPKGQAYLAKRHSQHIRRETVRDAIECQVSAMV